MKSWKWFGMCALSAGMLLSGCDWLEVFTPDDAGTADSPPQEPTAEEEDGSPVAGATAPMQDAGYMRDRSAPTVVSECQPGAAYNPCDLPLAQYAFTYEYVSGSCGERGRELLVRFDADQTYYDCEDNDRYVTEQNYVYLDRVCTTGDSSRQPKETIRSRAKLRQNKVDPTVIDGEIDIEIQEGPSGPCRGMYTLRGAPVQAAR